MLNIAMSITPYLPLVAKRASVLHGSVLDANHLAKWVSFECKTTSQPNQENGTINHKGQATGNDSKIYTTVVHDFTQSNWKDYRGGN
jgi:hypothetical protein